MRWPIGALTLALAAASIAAARPGAHGAADQGRVAVATVIWLYGTTAERPVQAGQNKYLVIRLEMPVSLPQPLRRRTFRAESYVVLNLRGNGVATGCRPLRPSVEGRLDRLGCELLMRPHFFDASMLPPRVLGDRAVIGFQWRSLTAAAYRREAAERPPIMIDPRAPAPR
jgi:hypothetical protein